MGLVKQYDEQDERGFYEMPLVNYNRENLNYSNRVYAQSNTQFLNGTEEIDVSHEILSKDTPNTNLNSRQGSQDANRQKLSYVWVEAFFLCNYIIRYFNYAKCQKYRRIAT